MHMIDISMRAIVRATSLASGIGINELTSDSRGQRSAVWRMSGYAIGAEFGHSKAAIGRAFNRDHTTVGHGLRRRTAVRSRSSLGAKKVEAMEMLIKEKLNDLVTVPMDVNAAAETCLADAVSAHPVPDQPTRWVEMEPVDPELDRSWRTQCVKMNERFAIAIVAAHPDLVVHLLRHRQQPTT